MDPGKPGQGGNAETLRRYWSEGAGAAKIRWGTPGDFDRCVREVDEYMPGRAKGYCNLLHKRALGYYPATHAKMDRGASMAAQHVRVVDMASTWDEAAHPRVSAGSAGGGEFTSGGGSSSSASTTTGTKGTQAGAKGAGAGTKTDPAAQALWDRMASMTPQQQAAYLKSLSPEQLQALGTAAFASGQAIAPGMIAAQTLVAGELSSRGLTLGTAKKATASKSSGGSKSGGGSKSSGGSSGGSSSGSSKKSSTSSGSVKKTTPPKGTPKPTTPPKGTTPPKAPAPGKLGPLSPAKPSTPPGSAPAPTTPAKPPVPAPVAGPRLKNGVPTPGAKAKRRRVRAMSYTDRIVLELAAAPDPGPAVKQGMAAKGMAMADGSFRIPDATFLRKAMQAYGRCPPEKRAALVNLIRRRARELNQIQAPDVQNFLKTHTAAPATAMSGPAKP